MPESTASRDHSLFDQHCEVCVEFCGWLSWNKQLTVYFCFRNDMQVLVAGKQHSSRDSAQCVV